jgi:hypothetical protein
MSAQATRRRQKTFAPRLVRPAPTPTNARTVVSRAPARPPPVRVLDPVLLRPPDPGRPLEPEVRRRLEEALGRPLAHVRIHDRPADRERARDLGAHAFTYRHHIWLGPHASASDLGLIAHEVTHVVQQGFAPPAAQAAANARHAVHSAGHAEALAARAGPGPAGVAPGARGSGAAAPPAPAPSVQRLDVWGRARRAAGAVSSGVRSAGRAVASGARAVGGAVVEIGGNVLELTRQTVLPIIRRVAPGFLKLFEGDGITGFLRRLVERGLRSLFDGLLGPLRGIFNFEAVIGRVSQAVGWISAVAGQIARGGCDAILSAARRVRDFFGAILEPVAARIRGVADRVSGFFRSIWEAIGAPVMDILKRIGGAIWDSFKGFVSDVGAVIRRVREALGGAWQRVKGWFGIRAEEGEEEGGGLWNWIKGKASAIGQTVSRAVRPVIGPLRTVGGVLLMIVPGGQILVVMRLWPHLRQAWEWLSQRWSDLNLIPRARHFLANTVLPALMNAAESVGLALVAAADWLLGLLDRVTAALSTALRAATGLLGPLGRLIGFALQQFRRLVAWARGGLRAASRNMRSLLQRLVQFLGVVLDIMKRLIAIAVNPFGIVGFLAGTLWRLVPDCLKGPIIDFILDIIIRVLRALPPMPQLGPLWALVKSAALGFLERVRSFAMERKVNVSKKMARIVSGMSPSFAFGYLKGLGIGLWEEITGPFRALAALFELPALIQNFLSSLGVRLCELIDKIRCFATTLAGRVFGTIDDVLSAIGELFSDPGRILDIIRCAIEGALSAVASLGATIADKMMEIFESADEEIGERLGRLTALALVQVAFTYFTAGVGTALGFVQRIASALRTVGRAIGQVLGVLRGLFGRLVGAVRGIASRLARGAASGAGSVLGRLGSFFRSVASWFGRLLRRIGGGIRRRFLPSRQQLLQWQAFLSAVRGIAAKHAENGTTRSQLAGEYRRALDRFRRGAKRPAFITRRRARWRLWARRVKGIRPRRVATVLLDRATRWRYGTKDVKKRLRRIRGRDTNRTGLDAILQPINRKWEFRTLYPKPDSVERDWDIMGSMSSEKKITEVDDLTGLHDGSMTDPIPIHWYKPPGSYPTSIQIRLRHNEGPLANVPMMGNTRVIDRDTEERRVGVGAGNRVDTGDRLYRQTTPRGRAAPRFASMLRRLGYDLSVQVMDADHVKDLAFGGVDHPSNLWPLARGVNQRASTMGHWYSRYRIEFIDRKPGKMPKGRIRTIGSLRGKWFSIIGTTYPPSPNPGGRDPA